MEKNEALMFLGISDVLELEDAYEQKIFEWKNFFVNRFPIPTLFRSKIKQLEKLDEAYAALGGEVIESSMDVAIKLEFSSDFKEAFHQFQEQRAQLKSKLFSAFHASEVISVVQGLINLTQAYAEVWNDENLATTGIVMSKEPDPMDLLEAINDAGKSGVHNISKIDELPEGHLVLNEAKRLSLLIKR